MNKLQKIVSPDKLALIEPIMNKYPKYKNQIIDFILVHHSKLILNKKVNYSRFFVKVNNYKFSDDVSKILGIVFPKYDFTNEVGIFGKCSENKSLINSTVDEIKTNGFCKFGVVLDNDTCDKIINSLSPLNYVTHQKGKITGINLENPISTSHWVKDQKDIVNIKEVQQIITDPTILSICQQYLDTIPIIFQTNSWWSCKYNIKDGTHSFHQDFEDIKFIKIFLYLNDINNDNGPHVYAKKSRNNLKLPNNKYKASTRVTDKFVSNNYEVNEITGKKGTLLFVDTNGFHKGKKLTNGHRILVQLEYGASCMYEQISIPKHKVNHTSNEVKNFMNKYDKVYHKYN